MPQSWAKDPLPFTGPQQPCGAVGAGHEHKPGPSGLQSALEQVESSDYNAMYKLSSTGSGEIHELVLKKKAFLYNAPPSHKQFNVAILEQGQ